MRIPENAKHDLLLVIISMVFILFVTGCEGGTSNAAAMEPIVIP